MLRCMMLYVSVVSVTDCFIDIAAYVSSVICLVLTPSSLCGPGRVIHPLGRRTRELEGGASETINPGLSPYL